MRKILIGILAVLAIIALAGSASAIRIAPDWSASNPYMNSYYPTSSGYWNQYSYLTGWAYVPSYGAWYSGYYNPFGSYW
jgi:hypothetical protein